MVRESGPTDGPSALPGRLLDPVSNDGARGMIVTPPKPARATAGDRIRLTALCDTLFQLSAIGFQFRSRLTNLMLVPWCASEHGERATRSERAGEAAREIGRASCRERV